MVATLLITSVILTPDPYEWRAPDIEIVSMASHLLLVKSRMEVSSIKVIGKPYEVFFNKTADLRTLLITMRGRGHCYIVFRLGRYLPRCYVFKMVYERDKWKAIPKGRVDWDYTPRKKKDGKQRPTQKVPPGVT